MSTGPSKPETAPILACTVSRDIEVFDLLVEDMESLFGAAWGDLNFSEMATFLGQPEALDLEVIAIAINDEDENEGSLRLIKAVIAGAKSCKIKVILTAEDVSSPTINALMQAGVDEFIPSPLSEGALSTAINRNKNKILGDSPHQFKAHRKNGGSVFAIHGLAGGTGATTFAVNLAWELANVSPNSAPSVCLLDFDLQFGSVATLLDLPCLEIIYRMLLSSNTIDADTFGQSFLTYKHRMQVLTAPADILPLDLVNSKDIKRIITLARNRFEYVVIDMPSLLVPWTHTVLKESDLYFGTLELDIRSTQNALRFKHALQHEGLPIDKLRYVLNRTPNFANLSGKSKIKRLADCLDAPIEFRLPDGGRSVHQSNESGQPLAIAAPKNILRKQIAKTAASLYERQGDYH